jgi:hypothetical protein
MFIVRVKPNNQHPASGVLCERRHIAPLTGCEYGSTFELINNHVRGLDLPRLRPV